MLYNYNDIIDAGISLEQTVHEYFYLHYLYVYGCILPHFQAFNMDIVPIYIL